MNSFKIPHICARTVILAAGLSASVLLGTGWIDYAPGGSNTDPAQCIRNDLEANPANAKGHYKLGLLMLKSGNWRAAKGEIEKAKAIDASGAFAGGSEVLALLERQMEARESIARGR